MNGMRKKAGGCPLGCVCTQLKEDEDGPYLEVCPWYLEFPRNDSDGKVEAIEGKCSVVWDVIFSAQQSEQMTGIQQAAEGGRNQTKRMVEIIEKASLKRLDNGT